MSAIHPNILINPIDVAGVLSRERAETSSDESRHVASGRFISFNFAVAAILLGGAIAVNDGRLHWQALQWLAIAIFAMAGSLILCRSNVSRIVSSRVIEIVLILAVAFQIAHLALVGVIAAWPSNVPMFAIRLCMLMCTLGILIALSRRRTMGIALMIGAFGVAGFACIRAEPHSLIDVLEFQKHSAAALARGDNPYRVRYRDIYHGYPVDFYGPGVSQNGWLTYSFPYPPLSAMLVTPAHFAGDVRYAHLAAVAIAAGLIAACGRNMLCVLAAALLLSSPRGLYIVQSGWTEPFLILFAALLTYCALHCKRAVWIALGLLLGVKQYLILLIPLTRLLGPAMGTRLKWRRAMLAAALLAAATIVPFFVLDPQAFVRGVIQWQLVQPFRYDALSFTAMRGQLTGETASGAAGFVAAGVAILIALWKAPRNVGGFMAAAALVFVSFFALNKQAFCNYYFFVIGLCCSTIAGLTGMPASQQRRPALISGFPGAKVQSVARSTDKRIYSCDAVDGG